MAVVSSQWVTIQIPKSPKCLNYLNEWRKAIVGNWRQRDEGRERFTVDRETINKWRISCCHSEFGKVRGYETKNT